MKTFLKIFWCLIVIMDIYLVRQSYLIIHSWKK